VVVVEEESMLCFLLINFIDDREIDGLVADLAKICPTHHHLHIIFLPSG